MFFIVCVLCLFRRRGFPSLQYGSMLLTEAKGIDDKVFFFGRVGVQEFIRDITQTHKNTYIHERIIVLNWTFWFNEGGTDKKC